MNRSTFLLGALLVLGLIGGLAWTQATAANQGLVQTNFPSGDDPGPPFYARVEPFPPHFIHDGEWAAIVFYRDPGCSQLEDFNLLTFFDQPAAFGCDLEIEGTNLWEVEPGTGAPKIAHFSGLGSVPVWFVPYEAIAQAAQDGHLTVGELAGLEGLLVGYAQQFNEVLHPNQLPPELGGGGNPNPKLILDAHGELEDGREFGLHFTQIMGEVKAVRIQFR